MGLILGPVTYLEINGHDITDHVSSVTFTGVEAATAPTPTPDWETLKDAYSRLVRRSLMEDEPSRPRVIDQDGNPVSPPPGWLRNLGRS